MFGKDEVLINNTKVVQCDIDQQPGIASVVGIPNSSFINLNPFEANLSLLNRTAIIKPLNKERRTINKQNDFSFSSRSLQSKLCHKPKEIETSGGGANAIGHLAQLLQEIAGRKN